MSIDPAEFDETEKINSEEIDIDQYLSDDEIPTYKLYANNYFNDDEVQTIPFSGGMTFHQYLSQQIVNLILSDTEKHNPFACFKPWYGSCPINTTFTFLNGHKLKAAKILLHFGYII